LWPGWIPLRSVRFRPGDKEVHDGLESYNQEVLSAAPPGSAIPNFILNSTALNSGSPFRFSSTEIGDPRLGYFRYDEIPVLSQYKNLLDRTPTELCGMLTGPVTAASRRAALVLWWRTRDGNSPIQLSQSNQWTQLLGNSFVSVPKALCDTNFGRLRQLKLPAWYVRIGAAKGVTGGVNRAQHLQRFNEVLGEIDPTVPPNVTAAILQQDALGTELLDFAIELYYIRSADAMSPRLQKDFEAISMGTAVAASANFPPVFPPLVLLGIYDDLQVTRLGLSDGGVYDNLGITTLLDEGCTYIIASDTGAPFDVKQRVTSRYLGMIARLPDVLTDDVAEQQRTRLRERRRVSQGLENYTGHNQPVNDLKDEYGLKALAFFTIDSVDPPGANGIPLPFECEAVARLRTDLDSFGDLEVAALIDAGYDRADRFLHAYFAGSPYAANNQDWNSAPDAPCPIIGRDAARIAAVLEAGQHRFFRSLRLWSIPSWSFTVAALGALLYMLRHKHTSVASLVGKVPTLILSRLENPIPSLPGLRINTWAVQLATTTVSLVSIIFVLATLGVLVFKIWPSVVDRFRRSRAAQVRWAVWVMKWVRAIAPAFLLFLGLTPVWLAVAAFLVAFVSYFAYNKPFLWKTRMGRGSNEA
jgi:hypothetical protein